VRAKKTILVSGGTSTGKTTFLNALLREVPVNERLVLIEDTPELVVRHPNAIGRVAARGREREADVTMDDLLVASLRLRPERIIMGEVRGVEAFTFLRAVNTGHPGSMSTIHADSPQRAVEQLALLVVQAGSQLKLADVVEYALRVIDVRVQLRRDREGRNVPEIVWHTTPDP
jgi:type IV secretion system protein VirB11